MNFFLPWKMLKEFLRLVSLGMEQREEDLTPLPNGVSMIIFRHLDSGSARYKVFADFNFLLRFSSSDDDEFSLNSLIVPKLLGLFNKVVFGDFVGRFVEQNNLLSCIGGLF